MARYDSALTTFSPDGNLYQVKYAFEAVQKGKSVVGVRGADCVVLGVERPVSLKLQDSKSERKLALLDNHLVLAFSGLTADARVLIDRARVECQSYRLTVEDKPSVEYIARWLAGVQQKYTQRGGVRPFGVSCLVGGIDSSSGSARPALFKTEPTGNYMEWKACSTGQKWEQTSEFLSEEYKEFESKMGGGGGREEAVKLCVESLMQVVEVGRPLEVWVLTMESPDKPQVLTDSEINNIRDTITKQREAEKLAREQANRD